MNHDMLFYILIAGVAYTAVQWFFRGARGRPPASGSRIPPAPLRNSGKPRFHLSAARLMETLLTLKTHHLILIGICLGAAVGALTGGKYILGVLVGGAATFVPRMVLRNAREKRIEMIETQLMDSLILMGNVLKSGLDISAAIEMVSVNMKPPIAEEFKLVLNSFKLGTPLETALYEMSRRVPSRLLETVVYSINIQRESGGNIVKTFDQLVTTIREEGKLQLKLRSYTAQGRMQIIFLSLFPWGLGVFFYFTSPEFMEPALNHKLGQILIVLCLIWEGIGVYVTKKLITVRV